MHEGKGRRLNKPKRVAAFVFISPAVLFLVVFSVIPMLYSFGISFFHYNTPIYGVLNGLLVSMGLDRVEWLSAVVPARIALVIVEVWATTPLCMLIFMAALKTVPEELLEAATIDGANWRQKFFQVIMPLIRNFTVLVLTMRFMDAIRMFDIVYNLTNGGPGTSTETLASTIYKMAFRYYNVGEGSAGAFIFFVLIVLFSLLIMKLTGKEE